MRMILAVLCVGLWLGCTKPNPAVCCINDADCAAAGIPVGRNCEDGDGSAGSRTLRLENVLVQRNAFHGIQAQSCALTVRGSTIGHNNRSGLRTTDTSTTIDASSFTENADNGISVDGGISVVTNSVFAHNGDYGVDFYADVSAASIHFNTIADNSIGGLRGQNGTGVVSSVRNNIVARNLMTNLSCSTCSTAGNLILGSDISALKFVSPDVAPYDYHLMDGSSALGAAVGDTSVMTDLDGEMRPATGADVGADERP